ncbi:hypothetical protein I4U23_023588 [Adineta vaga]|nr:hypothetical protein I4U23_023588 [Adineta vaga]
MLGLSANPNSIYIPTVQTGCMKAEFDSTYPVHLHGIISQEEFQGSINKINRTISSNVLVFIVGIIFGLCVLGGMVCFITGGISGANASEFGFPVLFGVGIGLTSLGSLTFGIGCCIIQSQRSARMRQAISEESMKYSSRSPSPCSWRLNISRGLVGAVYGYNHHAQMIYHIVIDIGRANTIENETAMYYSNSMVTNTPMVFLGQQANYTVTVPQPPPPPYTSPIAETCRQCGVVRQDPTANFCPSCGQLFKKY